MTDREHGAERIPSRPPSRPQFEFQPPPSVETNRVPGAVVLSHRIWLAAAGVGVVAAILMLLSLPEFRSTMVAVVQRDFPGETQATTDRAIALAQAVLICGTALIAIGQAGFAALLRRGRGFARFALWSLLALAVLDTYLSLGVVPTVSGIALVLSLLLAVVASVCMVLPGTHRWFATQTPP